VPPVTGVLIRARNVPDTLPGTTHSVVLLAGTWSVLSVVQTIAPSEPDPGAIGIRAEAGRVSHDRN
jgi:hypothetical protein